MQAVIDTLAQHSAEDHSKMISHVVQRGEALEAGQGATAHFHLVQGVGDVPGGDETKGATVAMPKHTARRHWSSADCSCCWCKKQAACCFSTASNQTTTIPQTTNRQNR